MYWNEIKRCDKAVRISLIVYFHFSLSGRCLFLIGWEIFLFLEISASARIGWQPCHSRAQLYCVELPVWEQDAYFDVSYLPFLVFVLKQNFANAYTKWSSKRISIDLISALLKCHFMYSIPGIGLQSLSPEVSFFQSKTIYYVVITSQGGKRDSSPPPPLFLGMFFTRK